MKRNVFIPLLLAALLFASCSRYGYVSVQYPVEPKVFLPEEIDEIAVINRTLNSEEAEEERVTESILSTEIAGSDRRASDESIKGVLAASQGWQGKVVVIPKKVHYEGTGTRQVPELLDWESVSEICEEENSDALLVLETFDSNTDLLKKAAVNQIASLLATGEPSKNAIPGRVNMDIAAYWRLYEPETRTIIDQYQHNSSMSFNLVGGLPPVGALPEAAYHAGESYINRFLPSYYMVKRQLYKKTSGSAKKKFKAGYRKTEVANWDGAIDVWMDLAEDAKYKTAGRSCLNIAVANEVLGNTDKALKWAQKAYEDYDDKLARDYAKVLLRRKNIEE